MVYLYIILLLSGMIYISYIEYFRKGLSRLRQELCHISDDKLMGVTVIIPARDEEKNISKTVNSVLNQNYPENMLNVIAVNDRSNDSTGKILDSMSRINSNLSVIHIREVSKNISPKKNAILTAVRSAKDDLIVTTDADCIHDPDWIRSLVFPLTLQGSESTGVVAGLTVFSKRYDSVKEKFWQKMQNIDYVSHSLIAAGSIGMGRAFTANGSNLLVRKELYDKEHDNLQSELASGDDFFMIQAARESKYTLRFVINRESIVKSLPVNTVRELIEQRSRWASKAAHASNFVLYFAVNTFIFYLGIIFAVILTLTGFFPLEYLIVVLMIKLIPETLFLSYGFGRMGLDFELKYYIPLQFFHIPFSLLAALKGKLFGFEWKGMKYRL